MLEVYSGIESTSSSCRAKLRSASDLQEVHVIGRCKGQRILMDQDYVVERQEIEGRTLTQKQPEGSFSQPNATMCVQMVSWATRQVRDSPGDCLELYCGNGNFTLPMSQHFRQVVATEVQPHCSCSHSSVQTVVTSMHTCDIFDSLSMYVLHQKVKQQPPPKAVQLCLTIPALAMIGASSMRLESVPAAQQGLSRGCQRQPRGKRHFKRLHGAHVQRRVRASLAH